MPPWGEKRQEEEGFAELSFNSHPHFSRDSPKRTFTSMCKSQLKANIQPETVTPNEMKNELLHS